MPLFGGKSKNPAEIVKALKESILALEKGDAKKSEKVSFFLYYGFESGCSRFDVTSGIRLKSVTRFHKFFLAPRRSGSEFAGHERRFIRHGRK